MNRELSVKRVETPEDREDALAVLEATYLEEKRWVQTREQMFPADDLDREAISWFTCYRGAQPVGVVRVLYEPPIELYQEYGFAQIDPNLDVDVEAFVRNNRIAEIGRFAVVPEYRRFVVFAASLMRAASEETVRRGFSHYVTDVFEGEQHSPYDFHTRVMGFVPVATHEIGELNCNLRRITLILDLRQAYARLSRSKNKIYRMLTEGWTEDMHHRLAS
ncbi:MAG: GNAT family N-acetyltransferase [Xanthomonadales bacterium]|jgi:GNAT superfamily N-acetyltransferase|nr:GNAT family N-acetyltransferase [Xanthomonadales bacterium]